MLPDYRQDKWNLIFTDVLMKTLRCAFLSASVSDFIICSIESLSLKIICDQKERILVLENLWKVFQVSFIIIFSRYCLKNTYSKI